MTKNEAMELFKEIHEDFMENNKDDKVAIRTAWNDFTDALMKDNEITENQYNTWSQPF